MTEHPLLIIVLAAGKGVRMRSELPKVLHQVGGRSMLAHVLATLGQLGPQQLALVVGPGMDAVRAAAVEAAPGIEVCVQPEQLGTADAVLAARALIERQGGGRVLVVFADSPLLRATTLRRMLDPVIQVLRPISPLAWLPSWEPPRRSGRMMRTSLVLYHFPPLMMLMFKTSLMK
jgi:bifunctional N-acetylglucosamine-1-phosphate-uridyltransferase/glucosamine-1-phosphate-acetyltransferase GlmU-like protein